MRVNKNFTINLEVIQEFELSVPHTQRSRVLDALMIKYLVEENEE
tara:strand:- start:747 stop:881 length:135 start_codon:yes stop_codon:yes gene_type:complete